jgi:hypothetical protein
VYPCLFAHLKRNLAHRRWPATLQEIDPRSGSISGVKTRPIFDFLEPNIKYSKLAIQPDQERLIPTSFGLPFCSYKKVSLCCTLNVSSHLMGTIKKHSIGGAGWLSGLGGLRGIAAMWTLVNGDEEYDDIYFCREINFLILILDIDPGTGKMTVFGHQ